jgi:urocanate reductase
MLEASKNVGGTSLLATTGIGFGNLATYEDMMKARPYSDPALGKVAYDSFEEYKTWLTATGIPWKMSGTYIFLGTDPIPVGPRQFFDALRAVLEKAGGKVLMETKAVKLYTNQQGAVIGMKAVGPGGIVNIKAKAAVLATGGFQNNKEMMVRYVARYADLMGARCVPYNDGSGIQMGVEVGAKLSRSFGSYYGTLQAWPLIIPQEPAAYEAADRGVTRDLMADIQMFSSRGIVVNLEGQRFVDESQGDSVIANVTAQQRMARAFVVLDQKIRTDSVGKGPVTQKEYIQLLIDNGADVVVNNSIAELAASLAARGVHKANFLKTLDEFNKAVDEKTPEQLTVSRMTGAVKLSNPPFYAIPATTGVSATFGGLKINTKTEVLGNEDIPIPGLFATFCTAGGLNGDNYFASISGCALFGRIAGKSAAAAAA